MSDNGLISESMKKGTSSFFRRGGSDKSVQCVCLINYETAEIVNSP